jgi:hypothetical protein
MPKKLCIVKGLKIDQARDVVGCFAFTPFRRRCTHMCVGLRELAVNEPTVQHSTLATQVVCCKRVRRFESIKNIQKNQILKR